MPNRIIERRRHRRHRMKTGATVLCNQHGQRGCGTVAVTDFSVGGAQLAGVAVPALGARHRMRLHLPWYHPVTVDAQVVRSEVSSSRMRKVGVRWTRITQEQQQELEGAIAAREAELPEPAVLVVGDGTTLVMLERPLRLARRRPILVTTLVDALSYLDSNEASVDAVVIDPGRWARPMVDQLLEALEEDYPRLARLLLQPGTDLDRQLKAVV